MKIAVIPARGGSKRIPKKNIRDFLGKPIIAYSIKAAMASRLFDRIVVSTDNEKIASVAKQYGAEVPFLRPPSLADDYTGTNEVVKHSIEWFEDHGDCVDYACCVYATAPFIQAKYLQEGFEKLISSGRSFAFSVTSFPFPIQRAIKIGQDSTVTAFFPEKICARSQDLEEAYHDAGQFYWGTAEAFLNDIPVFSPKSISVILPRYLAQDIDTLEDWRCAELMFLALQHGSKVI